MESLEYIFKNKIKWGVVYFENFYSTFQIPIGRIDRILKAHGSIPKDMRGKTDGYCRRTNELMTNTVIEHIKSFLPFENHNTWCQNSGRIFLNFELNWIYTEKKARKTIWVQLMDGHKENSLNKISRCISNCHLCKMRFLEHAN